MNAVTCSSTRSCCAGEIDACMHASIAETTCFRPCIPSGPRPTLDGPMEAATPLRNPSVRIVGDRVAVDGLVVADECVVRLVREGDDPVRVVEDAIEIGARVLDREQTG